MQPETRYALVQRERVAYQVVGEGAIDLVFSSGSYANVDLEWDDPLLPDSCGASRHSHA